MDTNICDKTSITLPTKQHLRSSYDADVHDFSVSVRLADSKVIEFFFFIWMYGGEHLFYQDVYSIAVDITGNKAITSTSLGVSISPSFILFIS
ncbi:hypothetical protein LSH36_683g00003 [Paralvinella palmiformis]|uniref:Uncharacterized protein n=1 Tax=Paralvinella palmiformis TaxID=53620 RepID=A0AAD9J2Y0_9ANNE|nr:hypothetical protein LSH36_683g00003 [Paralvinella palmiformis]